MARKKVAGVEDSQIFILKCPKCRVELDVTNFRTGPLDRPRGIHHVKHYGWLARCPECGETWGDFLNPQLTPSMWVLMDLVEGTA